MKHGAVLRQVEPGWAAAIWAEVYPGAHVVVFGGTAEGLEARRTGFEVRDSFLVLSSKMATAWLFRKPCEEPTIAEQMLKTGTGALWIDGCRVGGGEILKGGGGKLWSHYRDGTGERAQPKVNEGEGRWPSNLVLVGKVAIPNARYYPQFSNEDELVAWFERLIMGKV